MGLFKPDVDKLAAKRDFNGLIAALAHRKADVRKCAADAMRRLCQRRSLRFCDCEAIDSRAI